MNSSKRNKSKAWIGTLIFHSLLVLLFFFTGLSYTIPPPPEEGISINFGTTQFADGENEIQQEQVKEFTEEISVDNPATEEITTQESIETIETKKEEKKEDKTTENTKGEDEIKEENQEEKIINKKAIFNPNKNKGNEGNNSGEGNMGEEDGDPNSTHYSGGGFGDGLSEIGSYRSTPEDLHHPLEMGKGYITINVVVNSEGKIIDIDDNSFFSTLGYIGSYKRKNLYLAIKQQLRYGPATGKDKSDKVAKLKLIFTH
ncbi:MAG: hypothetical protein CMD22_05480 [Flavobacteriales bacterium]|nr:hypothetical protein [Flavobacteriales bacterium]|tara:strand:+ start:1186 stop:1959 length:774 start_codon:yes stop_codon:yes gene_type:complete